MRKKENGITLIALAVTIIVILILSSVSISMIKDKRGPIKEAQETAENAQRESIIQKIEADLYSERVKKGRSLTEQELIELITRNDYGTVAKEDGVNTLTTKDRRI